MGMAALRSLRTATVTPDPGHSSWLACTASTATLKTKVYICNSMWQKSHKALGP